MNYRGTEVDEGQSEDKSTGVLSGGSGRRREGENVGMEFLFGSMNGSWGCIWIN